LHGALKSEQGRGQDTFKKFMLQQLPTLLMKPFRPFYGEEHIALSARL
jgi:hypothetical protein